MASWPRLPAVHARWTIRSALGMAGGDHHRAGDRPVGVMAELDMAASDGAGSGLAVPSFMVCLRR